MNKHRTRRTFRFLLAVGATLLLLGVASGASAVVAPHSSVALGSATPLSSSFYAPSGSWATFPMGRLQQVVNTFWQQVVLTAGSEKWHLETPPGVADNGGLVIAPYGEGAVVGFEPSQLLGFSPLAVLSGPSGKFDAAVLPYSLASVPDSLAVTNTNEVYALTRNNSVLAARSPSSNWNTVLRKSELDKLSGTPFCSTASLTAIAIDNVSASAPLIVGTSCTKGDGVGIFEFVNGSARLIGPKFEPGTARTKVLRLSSTAQGIGALVAFQIGNATSLIVFHAKSAGARWTGSSQLSVGSGESIVSSGLLADGSFFVEMKLTDRHLALFTASGLGARWMRHSNLPGGTEVVASGAGNILFALAPSGKNLLIYEQVAGQAHFMLHQSLAVPLQYGSSS